MTDLNATQVMCHNLQRVRYARIKGTWRTEIFVRVPQGIRYWHLQCSPAQASAHELLEGLTQNALLSPRPYALGQKIDDSSYVCVLGLLNHFCVHNIIERRSFLAAAETSIFLPTLSVFGADAKWQHTVWPKSWGPLEIGQLETDLVAIGEPGLAHAVSFIASYRRLKDRCQHSTAQLPPITYEYCGNYRYCLNNTGNSSAHYGNCQVCGQPANSVYIQTEEKWYEYLHKDETGAGWSHQSCYVGHTDCLRALRGKRQPLPAIYVPPQLAGMPDVPTLPASAPPSASDNHQS